MNIKTTMTKQKLLIAAILLVIFVLCPLAACTAKRTDNEVHAATYTVSFNTNGGSAINKQYVKAGEKVVKPSPDPIKGGKTFDGWCSDAALTKMWDFDNDTVKSDLILYARWLTPSGGIEPTITEYTVVFVTNCDATVPDQSVAFGQKVTAPSAISNGDKVFDGWYKNVGCTELWDFAVDTVDGPTTLYAAWRDNGDTEVVTYTVTFNTQGGSAVPSESVRSGGRVTPPSTPVYGNKIFGGWFKNSACTEPWDFANDTVVSNTTLYAKWSNAPIVDPDRTTWTVTFESNGGTHIQNQTINDGGKVVRPADPTYGALPFGGWYKDADCTEPWDFVNDTVVNNMTLYAKWGDDYTPPIDPTISTATVTFNVGVDARKAGVYNPVPQTVNVGSRITMPTVTRPGYTLSGWRVENGSTKWNFSTGTVTANMTLFAEWTAGGSSGGDTDDREDYTPSNNMQQSNTLYIHYLRSDGNYTGWHVWAWESKVDAPNTWHEPDSALKDESGIVIPVPLSSSSTTVVSFIVAKGDWQDKDGEDDNSLDINSAMKVGSSYHWFVRSGSVAYGTAYLQKEGASGSTVQTTEPLRASRSNVDRSYAASLPTAATATTCDEMGVGYQIFVASFCDSDGDGMGDIRGIISKLDYLDSLNVDVLWLTPIQSSDSSHGYDCYDYYAIDPKFGTNADYRELVYKAHQKGMKIIMDLVVNHTSQKNEWFVKSKAGVVETVTYQDGTTETVNYRDLYRWNNTHSSNRWYSTGDGWYFYSSFGSSMPELNYDYQPARNLMADVAMYWMHFGLDGFRSDAIKHLFMWDESENKSSDVHAAQDEISTGYDFNLTKDVEWFKEFNYKLKAKFPNCFILGEQLSGDPDAVAPFYAGMDSLFDFNTYYDLPGRLDGNAQAAANSFNSNAAKYANYRNDRPINSMITSNHDIQRLYNQIGNGDVQKTKLYFAVIMTLPGLSWIYYGDEIGLVGGPTSNDQYQRQSMKWTENWQYKCSNNGITDFRINESTKSVATQEADDSSLLNYVKALTQLRNDYPTLISGTATCSVDNGMLKITVTKSGESTIVVYHNFSSSSKTVSQNGTLIFGSTNVAAYGTVAFRQ